VFAALLCIVYSSPEAIYRNWPQWGGGDQHSKLQAQHYDSALLCGVQSEGASLPTTTGESIIFNGVHYYVQTGTGSIVAYDLVQQTNLWTISDIVQSTTTSYSSRYLNSPIYFAQISNGTDYLFGIFSVSNLTTTSWAFLVNITGGAGVVQGSWMLKPDEFDGNITGLVVLPQVYLLVSSIQVTAILPPFFPNGTALPNLDSPWNKKIHGLSLPSTVQSDDNSQPEIALFSDKLLQIVNPDTGDVTSHTDVPSAMELLFGSGPYLFFSSTSGGVYLSYPSMMAENIIGYVPMAASGTDHDSSFIGYNKMTDVVSFFEINNGTTPPLKKTWDFHLGEDSGMVSVSVDYSGPIYVVEPTRVIALTRKGKPAWTLSMSTSVMSPILVSVNTSSYLLIDTPGSSPSLQIYAAACNLAHGKCDPKGFTCMCNTTWFGTACDTLCKPEITCNGKGTCQNGTGMCMCSQDYYRSDCSQYCKTGELGVGGANCVAGQGLCDKHTGNCNCNPTFYNVSCQTKCENRTNCHGNGTCNSVGLCDCIPGGMFEPTVHGGPGCDVMVTNLSFVAFVLAAALIGVLCFGLCCCCFIEKQKKIEKEQYQPLAHEDKHQRRK